MLCCCERDEQTALRIMSDYNIDLGEWGVSSVPALMAKIADKGSTPSLAHSLALLHGPGLFNIFSMYNGLPSWY